MHAESSESVTVSRPATTVMRPGYTVHDRLLSAAMVGVSDPANPSVATDGSTGASFGEAAEADETETPAGTANEQAQGDQPPVS